MVRVCAEVGMSESTIHVLSEKRVSRWHECEERDVTFVRTRIALRANLCVHRIGRNAHRPLTIGDTFAFEELSVC